MTTVDTKSVGSYAEYKIGYDLISTNTDQGYHTITCYGVLNVTGNDWSAYEINASVAGKTQYIGYHYYSRGSHTLVSKDVNVYANDQGKCTYSFGGQLTSNYQSSAWASGTITLPDIPRSSIPTINNQTTNQPNFNIGDTIRIYTNRKSTSFTHKIYFNYGSTELEIATGITDYYDFDTSTVANALYQLIPSDTSYSKTISLKTYSGTTQIGTTKTCNYTANVVNSDPTFSNFDFADTNTTTTALTGNNKYNVNNYSNVTVTISTSNKAEAVNGATMSKYRFVIGNDSVDIPYSSSASVSGTINKASSGVYTVYAIDSRGFSTPVTKQATLIKDYVDLSRTTNPSSKRNTGVGEEYTLQYAGNIWNSSFGSVSNSITSATYRYKKSTDSTWTNGTTNITPTVSGNTFSFSGLIQGDTSSGFDISSSYNIEVTVSDRLSSVTYTVLLINGRPNIAIAQDGVSIGTKYDTTTGGALQVSGELYIGDSSGSNKKSILDLTYPIGSIYMSINNTSPATLFGGTWEQIQDTFLLSAGSTYTAGDTGGHSTHTITINEMPTHSHLQRVISNFGYPNAWVGNDSNHPQNLYNGAGGYVSGGTWTEKTGYGNETDTRGNGQAMSIMPPYLVVYMWKRTA